MCSVGVDGWCSSRSAFRNASNSGWLSVSRTVNLPQKPCRKLFMEEAALPWLERGPVECCALARLTAMRLRFLGWVRRQDSLRPVFGPLCGAAFSIGADISIGTPLARYQGAGRGEVRRPHLVTGKLRGFSAEGAVEVFGKVCDWPKAG